MVHRYFIFAVALLVVGGVWYYQYSYYRSPIVEEAVVEASHRVIEETDGVKHSIPLEDIQVGNPNKDGIPSIDEPVFESIYTADQYLDDNGLGLMVEVSGRYRFYPYQILVWHEIVNDTFMGEELLVTFCPLCYTGIVFDREVEGDVLEFGVSGKLWNSNLLMYDRATESYWSQALGEAVVGEKTGTVLEDYPWLIVSWDTFKTNYSSGQVLSRDTGFNRDYTQDPYEPEGYYESADVWFTLSNEDGRLHAKEFVYGYDTGDFAKAYSEKDVKEIGIINDQVGDEYLLVFWDDNLETVRAFSRQVDGNVLSFEKTDDFLRDTTTESLWNFDGEAVSGDHRGIGMSTLILEPSFWFSWATSYPQTEIYQTEN